MSPFATRPTHPPFGSAGSSAEPLLGVTTLESVGAEVDPQSQRLKKRPAVRLKGVRRSFDSQPARRRLGTQGAADGSARPSSSTTARRNRAASAPVTAR